VGTLSLTDLTYNAGQGLWTGSGTTSGTLAGLPFSTPTTFSLQLLPTSLVSTAAVSTEQFGMACSVLNLRLSPISVNLLGLRVDTSDICLVVTAIQGGGLLGDLLCALAGGDTSVLSIIQSLLTDLLSNALSQQMLIPAALADAFSNCNGNGNSTSVCSGTCQVLNLVIGPVNLNLLGLQVDLDDCNDGPVRVCLSATSEEGLLGNLLCGLAGQ